MRSPQRRKYMLGNKTVREASEREIEENTRAEPEWPKCLEISSLELNQGKA